MKMIEVTPSGGSVFKGITRLIIVAGILCFAAWFLGSRNPITPAGYVGYLVQGAIFGKAKFYGLQNGPTSPGRTWLLDAINVSITPYTYNEEFAGNDSVLSKDNLKISFRVHVLWKVRPDRVQQFVERYSTLNSGSGSEQVVETAYKNCVREPLRTYARDEVQQLNGLTIKDEITPIGQRVFNRVLAVTQDTPFEVMSVVVGNIQYPEQVASAVALKLAATQDLERKQVEIEQARKEKEKRIVEAEGLAQSMELIQQKLTPIYVQHEAIEAQKAMVNSPNHTTVYIPVGPMGVPLVGTLEQNKPAAQH